MRSVEHRLRQLLDAAVQDEFPAVDGDFELLAPDRAGMAAIVEFTGHAVVLADCDRNELTALGADGFGGASHPAIKLLLAGSAGTVGSHDAVLVTSGTRTDGVSDQLAPRTDLDDHPRVVRARHHRRDVSVHGDEHGFVTIGSGLVGRTELSVELLGEHGRGHGRRLIRAGLGLAPAGEHVWAQVAPGNAASLRAFLSCGFVPICAETIIDTMA